MKTRGTSVPSAEPADGRRPPGRRPTQPAGGFTLVWLGDAISKTGSRVTTVAAPLLAITALRASALQVGLLTAASTAAFLVVGLPTGALVDRVRRRPLLIGADLARAVLLASVPVAAGVGRLTLTQLYVVVLLHGVLTVLFDTAHQSFVPEVVGGDALVVANARLGGNAALSATVGPAVGGWLVQLLSAAGALVVDAASFLASAACLWWVHPTQPYGASSGDRHLGREVAEGMRFVMGHAVLRPVVVSAAMSAYFDEVIAAVVMVLLSRDIGLRAAAIGGLLACASVGAVAGAALSSRVVARLGDARAITLGFVTSGVAGLMIPATGHASALLWYVAGGSIGSAGLVVFNVTQMSYRQRATPPHLLGRMNATMRFLIWGVMPLGGVTGGLLAAGIGVRATVWVAAVGKLAAAVPLVSAAAFRRRQLPLLTSSQRPAR